MYRPHRFNFHREITDASFWLCEGKKRENRPQLVFKHVFGCLPNWMFKMPAGIRRLSEFEILICLFFSLLISEFPLFERLQVSRKLSFFPSASVEITTAEAFRFTPTRNLKLLNVKWEFYDWILVSIHEINNFC